MDKLDRAAIIDLLGRLGAADDQAVLAAARELDATMAQSGLTWDDLLRPSSDVGAAGAEADVPADEPPDAAAPAEPEAGLCAVGRAEAAKLIDRLLARKTISITLREDLVELKRSIADGGFDEADGRYVRALAKRLGV